MALVDDLQTQLTAVMALITAKLAAGPAANWTVGDVSFREADSLETLYEQRDKLIEQMRMIPSENISAVQNAVDTFGHDGTEYIGDDF